MPDEPPPLNVLVDRTIARDEATKRALDSMQYNETLTTEQLGDQDQVTKSQVVEMIIRPGTTPGVQVVSTRGDDLPSNPDEAVRQAQGKERLRQQMDISLRELVSRFVLSCDGAASVNGEPTYIVRFEPKPEQPYKNQTERVLNHLHGRLWISARDYTLLKTEATLADPVEIAWIFATISVLEFRYELRPGPTRFGPSEVTTLVRVDAPFLTIRQRMKVEMTQFEQRAVAGGRIAP